jgi:hypothetical protein
MSDAKPPRLGDADLGMNEAITRTIEQSTYLVLAPMQYGVHPVEVDLE